MRVGEIEKGSNILSDQRRRLAVDLKRMYEKGASIRAIAKHYGRSYGFIHRLLFESGANMRHRGGYHPADEGKHSPQAATGQHARRRVQAVIEVMTILLQAERAMWGTQICDRSSLSGSSIYPALGRAEHNGWVTTEIRKNRAKYYRLTDSGRKTAERLVRAEADTWGAALRRGLPGPGARDPLVPSVQSSTPPAVRQGIERSSYGGRAMAVSEEDSLRMRAAAMDKFLSGDVDGAVNIAKIHDEVTGNADKSDDSGRGDQK